MAISTRTSYLTKGPVSTVTVTKTLASAYDVGKCYSLWTSAPFAGSAPGAAAACTASTTGALRGMPTTSSGSLFMRASEVWANDGAFTLTLCDRLSHQSGLDATDTAEQTTNLPTAALTRYTDGVGVRALAEVYTQIGATARTFTITYTDTEDNTGVVSPASSVFGSANNREVARYFSIPLAAGDTGIKAVESVTLSASTGTAGNFGITLYYPIKTFYFSGRDRKNLFEDDLFTKGWITEVKPDACLFWLMEAPGWAGSSITTVQGTIELIEG